MKLKTRPVLPILFCVLLFGCAQSVWVKPGADQQAFQTDRYACERDSRQSGGFGTGIAGAIEAQNFFNGCLVARGWRLQDSATTETTRSSVQSFIDQRRNCISQVREHPKFASIVTKFSDIRTARYNFSQTADPELPTPRQAALWVDYVTEASVCIDEFSRNVQAFYSSEQMQTIRSTRSESDSLSAALARRQISWGDHATRSNQIFDSANNRMR